MSLRLPRFPETHERHLVESESIAPEAMADIALDHGVPQKSPVGRRKGEATGAAAVAMHAKAELDGHHRARCRSCFGGAEQPDGWHVTVDLVELRRIPAATDVIASYEAVLGPTGVLLSYRRYRRYFRDQMLEES